MCGIIGKLYFKKIVNHQKEKSQIRSSLRMLKHRGPDKQKYFLDKNIWLAHTRLAILDLSSNADQPMTNEDGSIVIIFNGEIYNFRKIKKLLRKKHKFISRSDTELLVHLYEEKGIDCLKFLQGMFAFALWDRRKKQLFLARDRLGQKPLKYYIGDNFIIFASELKAFIDQPDIPKSVDWLALDDFLNLGYISSPKTGFEKIFKLPPAHYMVVKNSGELVIDKYWDLDFSKKLNLSENEWQKEILTKLNESIKLRLQSDVQLGIHLSGGIDSGLITALASLDSKDKLTTFSIGFEKKDYNELPFSRLIAEKYETNHHELIVKPKLEEILSKLSFQFEEPFADPSIIPTWYLMKESKKHFTVALNGDGGDENFAGYRRYQVVLLYSFLKMIPCKKNLSEMLGALYKKLKIKDIYQLKKILSLPYSNRADFYLALISFINNNVKNLLYEKEFIKRIESLKLSSNIENALNKSNIIDIIDQTLWIDIHSYLPDFLLVKNDICSMAHSQEVRSPFLDHEFMELCAKMPSSLKLRNLKTKYILKNIAKKYLPYECFQRKKQGFIPPLEHWFRNEYYKYLKSELLDKSFQKYRIFNKNQINRLIKEHKNYHADNSYVLWTLLLTKHWLKTWWT